MNMRTIDIPAMFEKWTKINTHWPFARVCAMFKFIILKPKWKRRKWRVSNWVAPTYQFTLKDNQSFPNGSQWKSPTHHHHSNRTFYFFLSPKNNFFLSPKVEGRTVSKCKGLKVWRSNRLQVKKCWSQKIEKYTLPVCLITDDHLHGGIWIFWSSIRIVICFFLQLKWHNGKQRDTVPQKSMLHKTWVNILRKI